MQASTGPPAPSSDEDQDEQVWRDVKAETGYQSYKEYVETLEESGQRFKTLLGYLKNPTRWRRGAEISVLDIQKDGSTVTSFNSAHSDETPQTPHGLQFETDHKISTRLLQNLRSPPEDIPARIVLYSLPRGPRIHASIVETLGLGLDINPSFFESLIRMDLFHGRSVWRWLPTQMLNPVLGSNMIMIGDSIATIAQKYQRERHAPPVLVIAGFFDLHVGFSNDQNNLDEPYYRIFNDLMARKIGRGTSLFPSTVDRVLPDDLASMPSNYYLKLLSIDSYKDCYVDSEVDAILLVAVLPLLRHEILRLRSHCSMTDAVLRWVQFDVENPRLNTGGKKEEHYNMLDKNRFWLRRRLEGLQESRDNFQNLARSQNAANWLGTRTWLSQDADIREALAMARTKELEVRDYMQLQIGNLSISESRKSIQLSNQQMNEAKRGKKTIEASFVTFANRAKGKIRMKPIHLVSALTLMSLSHDIGFGLRTYQSCDFHLRNEPPTAESERSKCLVIRGDCIGIFASHGFLLVLS